MKIADEKKTMTIMVKIYCRGKHRRKELCLECQELLDYSMKRLENCPYGDEKAACGACQTKCYKSDMSEQMRILMRYAGPRMMIYHPILAVKHLVDLKK